MLDDVVAALRDEGAAVLRAPPGSGKSTLVPPALLDAGLAGGGEVVVLQPRRVAARAVARRLAALRGERLGGTIGYQVRFDRQTSKATRLRVVTEGVLTARLQGDPALEGVGAVVLDEFHERSLDADLALALLREVREALRPDLRVLVMSATLAPEPVARYLGGAPVVEAEGRQHPVDVTHLDRPDERPVGARVASGVRRVVDAMEAGEAPAGDVLAFLPGVGSIRDAERRLASSMETRGREVLMLHGRLDARAQDRVLTPGLRPRVVLATNLAETSLTIPGVRAVVDAGLVRRPRHDAATGLDRLETARISRASAEQRAGRAGRLGPGWALRLWTAVEHETRPEHDEPAIRRVDLAGLVLDLRAWGVRDPRAFELLDPPEPGAVDAAEELLARLGALDAPGGLLTERGRAMRAVPAHPRVARLLLAAADAGAVEQAAWLAALLQEPDAAPPPEPGTVGAADVLVGLERLAREPSRGEVKRLGRIADQLARSVGGRAADADALGRLDEDALGRLLLSAWPDRLARRRRPGRPQLILAGGGGAVLDRRSVVQDDDLLVAVDVDAGRHGERGEALVRSAARVDPDWLDEHPERTIEEVVRWDADRERAVAERLDRVGGLVLDRRPVPLTDRVAAAERLAEAAAADPERALSLSSAAGTLLARMALVAARVPEAGLPGDPRAWALEQVPALCQGLSSFDELRALPLAKRLAELLPWGPRQALDRLAPERLQVPSGSRIRLRYDVDGPPVLPARVQELFGWRATPRICDGRQPLVLHLLDPARRPLQVTEDLESFWQRTWPEVRKDMRSRYPKHRWPEDPLSAEPTRRTVQRRRRR